MVACRVLTLGSGSRTSLPLPRPMTMRAPSNVSEGDALAAGPAPPPATALLGALADRTTTVTGIPSSGRRDALKRRAIVVRGALDPLDDVFCHVAILVLAELLDAG